MTEFLEPLGITPYLLAKTMHVSQTRIGEILKGKRAITMETALRLSRALGTSEMFWVNLQNRFDAETVKDAEHDELDAHQHAEAPGHAPAFLHAGGCTRLEFRAVFPVQKEPRLL